MGRLSHQVKTSQSNLTKNARESKGTPGTTGEGSRIDKKPLEAMIRPL
jgi:hypothetical protein